VYDPIRSARPRTILTLVAAHFALTAIVNLVFFAGNTFRPLASATGGLFTGSLLANLVFIAVLVTGIILRFGGLRPYDVGLIPRNILRGFVFAFGIWAGAQVVHMVAGWLTYGTVKLSTDWINPGFMIGLVLTQIFGNALFEEIAYRGFLFPQLYLRAAALRARPWTRLLLALLISQGLFALSHIPNRIYLGMTPSEIALDLLMLLGWGTLYTLIYLRTDNLFIVVGIHALGNTPTTLFSTVPLLAGDGASILIYTLVILVLFGLPLLRKHRHKFRLLAEPRSEAHYGETTVYRELS
jgi:membrane protease YdiL (CAAX protease family)